MAQQATVIGAGIIGMCTASYLQRAGVKVTVLDPVAPGMSCSFNKRPRRIPIEKGPQPKCGAGAGPSLSLRTT